ncbi:MAG: putative transcriptional regulator [Ramlibacter sp.]|nr:putative transcriptional regulator [Ramlibacter sp.]
MVEFEPRDAPGHLLRRAQQLHAAVFAETVSSADLTTPQFAVLTALRSHPDVDQASLSQRLAIDRSTIADVANRLEERGLITRHRDPRDARRKVLALTDAGRELHDRTVPEVLEVGRRLVEPLDEDDRATFLRCLRTIIAVHDPYFDEYAAI